MIRHAPPCLLLGVLAAIPSALAHRLDAEYVRTDTGYRIEFFFADGSPAVGLHVTAQLPEAEPLEIGSTDDEGAVIFAPPAPGRWSIVGSGAGGHANSRNPLVIEVTQGAVATTPADPRDEMEGALHENDVEQSQAAPDRSRVDLPRRRTRGAFPWGEIAVSLGFIALLTLVTLAMMRRSTKAGGRATEVDELKHEVAHLRATVRDLREEIARLEEQRGSGTR